MTTSERAARKLLKTVLVPTDFSKGAERALGRALLLPLAQGARLHVLHVLPGDLPVKVRAKVEAKAKRTLDRVLSRACAGMTIGREGNLTSEILVGEAFVEIIRCSRRMGAELIVLGRHGCRPIRDMFIGTTAERVARKGDVPVLVVNRTPVRPYRRPLIATDLGASRPRLRQPAPCDKKGQRWSGSARSDPVARIPARTLNHKAPVAHRMSSGKRYATCHTQLRLDRDPPRGVIDDPADLSERRDAVGV